VARCIEKLGTDRDCLISLNNRGMMPFAASWRQRPPNVQGKNHTESPKLDSVRLIPACVPRCAAFAGHPGFEFAQEFHVRLPI
jgi:hypothetical protein